MCWWCGEVLDPLRVLFSSPACATGEQQPVVLHERCVKPAAIALSATLQRAALCVVCGDPVDPQRSTKRYCTERCKVRARCGRQFAQSLEAVG